ncbi:MAG: DUF938 domain-containing protein [Woeseiaceae bacterium]
MQTISEKPFSEAAAKNAAPVLEILRQEFQTVSNVLEIGSGTGQHAVCFASELEYLEWQTSDLEENHAGIEAWIAAAGLANVHAPLALDVTRARVDATYDAVYSANTAHIMSFDAVVDMMALAASVLRPDGVFCLYGPFRRYDEFNTPSNAQFDAFLRQRDAEMGIRDLEVLDNLAAEHRMQRRSLYAVPSNNLVVVWQMAE